MTEQPSSQLPGSQQSIDPAIIEAVQSVANRFGAPGLEELITEAQRELGEVQAAYARLAAETD